MKRLKYRVLLVMLLWALVPTIGFAQKDEAETDSPKPSGLGTPGLVNALGRLNLCPQALAGTSTTGCQGPDALPPIIPLQGSPEPAGVRFSPPPDNGNTGLLAKIWLGVFQGFEFDDDIPQLGQTPVLYAVKPNTHWDAKLLSIPHARGVTHPRFLQQRDVIFTYTHPRTARTINVYDDYSFEVENRRGRVFITGYVGGITGARTMVAYGTDTEQIQYAAVFWSTYYSALTPEGEFSFGHEFATYMPDFDEQGNLIGLTDTDGGVYDVEFDEDGAAWIRGSDGYEAHIDDYGAFELYDKDGNLVLEGNLSDDTDYFGEEFDDAAADDDEQLDDAADDSSDNAADNDDGESNDAADE